MNEEVGRRLVRPTRRERGRESLPTRLKVNRHCTRTTFLLNPSEQVCSADAKQATKAVVRKVASPDPLVDGPLGHS